MNSFNELLFVYYKLRPIFLSRFMVSNKRINYKKKNGVYDIIAFFYNANNKRKCSSVRTLV